MASILNRIATAILGMTTSEQQGSQLPRWLARPLILLSSDVSEEAGGDRQPLIREAVAFYLAAIMGRDEREVLPRWQHSPAGDLAVQVLPGAKNDAHRQALRRLGNYLQLVTMNHPGLAPILETAYHRGMPYLVARLGQEIRPLAQWQDLRLDPERAMRITVQIAEALEYAHHRGLIHGALSLDDILVGERGPAAVLGVGMDELRRELGVTAQAPPSPLTPPEVARGLPPDMRSDVYAVGALLYLLLTGKRPVPGRPVRVSRENPAVPAAVDQVLTQALAEHPADRYADLMEMVWELRLATRGPRQAAKRAQARLTQDERMTPEPARPAEVEPDDAGEPPAWMPEQPETTAAGAISGFPSYLPMPQIDTAVLEQSIPMPEPLSIDTVEIPPPPEVPHVDWEALLQPLNLSDLPGALGRPPHHDYLGDDPDPLQVAAEAARAIAEKFESGAKPAETRHPGQRPRRP